MSPIGRCAIAAVLFSTASLAAEPAAKAEIDGLLSALADSPCELYHEGKWHEGEEARAQLQAQAQAEFASAEAFIDAVGSDQVRCPGEEPKSSWTWLETQLRLMRR